MIQKRRISLKPMKKAFLTNGTLTYGKDRYRLEEIKAPVNYVLNQNPLVFSITNDTEPIKVIHFANRQARKNVKLFKYEEWNKKKTPLAVSPLLCITKQESSW